MFLNKLFSCSAFSIRNTRVMLGLSPLLSPSSVMYSEFIQNAILVFLSQSVFVHLGAKGNKTPDHHNDCRKMEICSSSIVSCTKSIYKSLCNSDVYFTRISFSFRTVRCFLLSLCKCRALLWV